MPILDIEVVVAEDEDIDTCWAQQIADAAGSIFDTLPGRTWVRMRSLTHSGYAENQTAISPEIRPVFVSVLKAKVPAIETLRAEIQQLTLEIAHITGRREENVHILYLPPAAGRISFGGTLVE
jgi:hypothetical protein